jgi:hypothetical protein
MIDHSNPGKIVWKYIELDKKIQPDGFLDRVSFYSTLVVQPAGHVLFWVCFLFFPTLYTYFGGDVNQPWYTMLFYIVSSLQVFYGSIVSWSEVVEHYNLGTTLMVWKILSHGLGLPLLEINSKNRNHQLFRYAAGARFLQSIC